MTEVRFPVSLSPKSLGLAGWRGQGSEYSCGYHVRCPGRGHLSSPAPLQEPSQLSVSSHTLKAIDICLHLQHICIFCVHIVVCMSGSEDKRVGHQFLGEHLYPRSCLPRHHLQLIAFYSLLFSGTCHPAPKSIPHRGLLFLINAWPQLPCFQPAFLTYPISPSPLGLYLSLFLYIFSFLLSPCLAVQLGGWPLAPLLFFSFPDPPLSLFLLLFILSAHHSPAYPFPCTAVWGQSPAVPGLDRNPRSQSRGS